MLFTLLISDCLTDEASRRFRSGCLTAKREHLASLLTAKQRWQPEYRAVSSGVGNQNTEA